MWFLFGGVSSSSGCLGLHNCFLGEFLFGVDVNFSLFGAGLLNGESDKTFVFLFGVSIRFSENEFVPLSS